MSAHSQLEMIVEPPPQSADSTWVLESSLNDQLVMTAHAVVCPSNGVVVAGVINLTSQAILLYKGTRVGQIEKWLDSSNCVHSCSRSHSYSRGCSKWASDATLWEMVTRCNEDSDRLNPIQQEQLLQVLQKSRKAFAEKSQDQGCTSHVQHHINTGDTLPILQVPRRVPVRQKEEACRALGKMMERKIVSPSSSPWSSRIVLVCKNDGSLRFCIDH